jgi:hypothetical protein
MLCSEAAPAGGKDGGPTLLGGAGAPLGGSVAVIFDDARRSRSFSRYPFVLLGLERLSFANWKALLLEANGSTA